MRTAIKILLTIAIVILGYLLIESIMNPIRFNKEKDRREKVTIERLKDIRTAQVAFKSKYGRYTGSFDTLIDFVKYDSFPIVLKIGFLTDDMIEKGYTERKALREGLITRDTSYRVVFDSIFPIGFAIDSIRYVPFADTNQFKLQAAVISTASGVQVEVFEASVLNNILLKGLDPQLIINYNAEREKITGFKGLRVGNINEPNNNAGNWE